MASGGKSKQAPVTLGNGGPSADMAQRILDAAYQCSDQTGISAMSLGEIAKTAQVSRPTVYRYFGGKSEIVETISELESVKVKSEVKRRLRRMSDFEEALTEALVLIVRIAAKNVYVQRLLADPDYAPETIDPRSRYHEMQKNWWGSFLTNAMERGDIASDLDIDEIVGWLTAGMRILLLRIGQVGETGQDFRRYVKRFVVYPLIAR